MITQISEAAIPMGDLIGQRPKRFEAGRLCTCGTPLSIYQPGKECERCKLEKRQAILKAETKAPGKGHVSNPFGQSRPKEKATDRL